MGIKRARPTSVCQFCRKRKVKCDKKMPCSNCIKYGSDGCVYESFPVEQEAKDVTDDDEELLKRLKMQVKELESKLEVKYTSKSTPEDISLDVDDSLIASLSRSPNASSVLTPDSGRVSVSLLVQEDKMSLYDLFDDDKVFHPLSTGSVLKSDKLLHNLYLGFNKNHVRAKSQNKVQQNSYQNTEDPADKALNERPHQMGKEMLGEEFDDEKCKRILVQGLNKMSNEILNEKFTKENLNQGFQEMSKGAPDELFKEKPQSMIVMKTEEIPEDIFSDISNSVLDNESIIKKEISESDWSSEQSQKSAEVEIYDNTGANESSSTTLKPSESFIFYKNQLNYRAKILGLMFFEGDMEIKSELITKIRILLPKRKEVTLLMDIFFNRVYPCFAIIDEEEFRSNIENILGPPSYEEEEIDQVNVEKKLDFAYLGILLIMLRITYLCLFTNIEEINEYNLYNDNTDSASIELKYLLNNPVNVDVINIAQLCLNQFVLVNNSNIVVLQLAIFVKYYKMYGLEYGEDIESSEQQMLSALILQMAYSLGLHREPDKLSDKETNDKKVHLGKKLFYHIYCLMASTSLTLGDPNFLIMASMVDVKYPMVTKENSNTRDVRLDKIFVGLINHTSATNFLNELCNTLCKPNEPFCIQEVDKLSDFLFQGFADDASGMLVEFLEDEECRDIFKFYFKSFKIKHIFQIITTLMASNFHFSNHYLKIGNYSSAMYHIKKLILLFYSKCFPIVVEILTNKSRKLLDICDFTITPYLQMCLHTISLISLSLLIKVKLVLNKLGTSGYELQTLLSKSITTFINFLKRLGNRYYAAWRCSKVLSLLLAEINKINVQNYTHIDTTYNFGFTEEIILELNLTISSCLESANDEVVIQRNNDLMWLIVTTFQRNESQSGHGNFGDIAASLHLQSTEELNLLEEKIKNWSDGNELYTDELFKEFFLS